MANKSYLDKKPKDWTEQESFWENLGFFFPPGKTNVPLRTFLSRGHAVEKLTRRGPEATVTFLYEHIEHGQLQIKHGEKPMVAASKAMGPNIHVVRNWGADQKRKLGPQILKTLKW